MTEPIDPQRDGSERDRLAPTGADTGPQSRASDADVAVPDPSPDIAEWGETSDDDGDDAAADPVAADPVAADPVADDPERANGQVAAALAELEAAADWPPADQVAAFTAAHETLQATLASIDDH